jgi:hypothetical protein
MQGWYETSKSAGGEHVPPSGGFGLLMIRSGSQQVTP